MSGNCSKRLGNDTMRNKGEKGQKTRELIFFRKGYDRYGVAAQRKVCQEQS